MAEHDEGEDDELSANDWEGVTVSVVYRDFVTVT
jgi:hypothetical protein